MTIATAGDYQTARRMRDKLAAIPIPDDLAGRTVLDLGCDHGAFSKLASDRGARRVLGVDRGREVRDGHGGRPWVDLVAWCSAQGWERCEFREADIGGDWPDFSEDGTHKWDVVFCFSLYHHVYQTAGDHEAIWRWLWSQTCPQGELLWEGPVDTRDPIAADRARQHGNFTRAAIFAAASRYYEVEHVGPAVHRPHREVWRCRPRPEPRDPGDGVQRSGTGGPGVHARANGGTGAPVRVAAVPRNAKPARSKPCKGCGKPAAAGSGNGARNANRTATVVARAPATRPRAKPKPARVAAPKPERKRAVPARPRPPKSRPVSGGRRIEEIPLRWPVRQRSGPPDPRLALVLGGGGCVWDDVAALEAMIGMEWPGLIITVNDIGVHWPGPVDHWCTLHAEKMGWWTEERGKRDLPAAGRVWLSRNARIPGQVIKAWSGGSSGLLGVQVAVDNLGCERVVGCGLPMERTVHFADSLVHPATKPWSGADTHWKAWKKPAVLGRLRDVFRCMSMVEDPKTREKRPSRMRDLFGAPDPEWLGIQVMEAAV